jgi:hypothetical protein
MGGINMNSNMNNNSGANQNLLYLMNSGGGPGYGAQRQGDGYLYPLGNEQISLKNENFGEEGDVNNKRVSLQKDQLSCSYCEEYYKMALFNSVPLKLFSCSYCHNMINQKSLQFYYKKYEYDINKKIRGSIEETLNSTANEKGNFSAQNGGSLKRHNDIRTSFDKQEVSTLPSNKNYSTIREREKSIEIEEVKEENNESQVQSHANQLEYDNDLVKEAREATKHKKYRIEAEVEEEPEERSDDGYNIQQNNEEINYNEKETETEEKYHSKNKYNEKEIRESREQDQPLKFIKSNSTEKHTKVAKTKELIEIAANDNITGSVNLADMFKKKKQGLLERLEKRKLQEPTKTESKEKSVFMEDYDKKKKINHLKQSVQKEESKELKESSKEIGKETVKEPNPALLQRLSNGEKITVIVE